MCVCVCLLAFKQQLQAPVFLLFLECVWQLLQQHSPAFQFSETYLTVLSDSLHVPIFSTFLFNSAQQRIVSMTTVWLLVQLAKTSMNPQSISEF